MREMRMASTVKQCFSSERQDQRQKTEPRVSMTRVSAQSPAHTPAASRRRRCLLYQMGKRMHGQRGPRMAVSRLRPAV